MLAKKKAVRNKSYDFRMLVNILSIYGINS